MDDAYITGIRIDKYRNIKDLSIELSKGSRKHLIITGNNGSGKTSLLDLLVRNFSFFYSRSTKYNENTIQDYKRLFDPETFDITNSLGAIYLNPSNKNINYNAFIMFYCPSNHLQRI